MESQSILAFWVGVEDKEAADYTIIQDASAEPTF